MSIRPRLGIWLGASVAIAVLALPAGAVAARRTPPRLALAGFTLRGSHGYRIDVLMLDPHHLVLGASKGRVAAFYAVASNVAGRRIGARLGRLGRVSVRFAPRGGRAGPIGGHCRNRSGKLADGVFSGTIRFAGERGYTRVRAHRARGSALLIGPGACGAVRRARSSAAGSRRIGPTTHLAAISRRDGMVLAVDALRFPGDRRVLLQASSEEHHEEMAIFRYALALIGGPKAFAASRPGLHPAFAVLRPPRPFSGSARFAELSTSSASWSGSLAVRLPGAGRVRLAGPDFASSLCRRKARQRRCGPFPVVRRNLDADGEDDARAQGSGSQSQAFFDARLSWSRYWRNSSSSGGSTP